MCASPKGHDYRLLGDCKLLGLPELPKEEINYIFYLANQARPRMHA